MYIIISQSGLKTILKLSPYPGLFEAIRYTYKYFIYCRRKVKRCARYDKNDGMVLMKRICSPNMGFRAANRSNDVTALVSLPGSGNTWMRQIIEEATGIYTGSVYCDIPLKKSGFIGELTINNP